MQKVFNTFYNRFVDFSNSTSMETKTINKFIKQSIYQKILSVRYSFNSRYMLDEANSPYRWTKSIFRKSFAEMDGKGAILPIIKSRKTFFVCGYDYAICLSNEPRISIELSYGNLKKFKKKKFKYKKKKIVKNSIIFLHISSYNPWHFYTEILSLANHIIDNNIFKNKNIYLPENKLFNQILKIIDPDKRIKFYKCNELIYGENCLFLEGTVGELILTESITKLTKKIHKKIELPKIKSEKYKEIYIGRGDRDSFRNRRKMLKEKLAIKTIMKKYPKLKIIRPGYLSIISTIKLVYTSKKIFSPLGTQLVLNSIFSKNVEVIHEIVPSDYYGFTTGQLVAKFLKAKYIKSSSKSKKNGWPLYNDQIINIDNLKKNL